MNIFILLILFICGTSCQASYGPNHELHHATKNSIHTTKLVPQSVDYAYQPSDNKCFHPDDAKKIDLINGALLSTPAPKFSHPSLQRMLHILAVARNLFMQHAGVTEIIGTVGNKACNDIRNEVNNLHDEFEKNFNTLRKTSFWKKLSGIQKRRIERVIKENAWRYFDAF